MTNRNEMRKRRKAKKPKIMLTAKAWEVITCQNNHPAYLTVRNIPRGHLLTNADTVSLGPQKIVHNRWLFTILCPKCSKPVFNASDPYSLYIRGHLRGPKGYYIKG